MSPAAEEERDDTQKPMNRFRKKICKEEKTMSEMFVKIHVSRGNAKLKKTEKLNNATVIGFDLPAGRTCP